MFAATKFGCADRLVSRAAVKIVRFQRVSGLHITKGEKP